MTPERLSASRALAAAAILALEYREDAEAVARPDAGEQAQALGQGRSLPS